MKFFWRFKRKPKLRKFNVTIYEKNTEGPSNHLVVLGGAEIQAENRDKAFLVLRDQYEDLFLRGDRIHIDEVTK